MYVSGTNANLVRPTLSSARDDVQRFTSTRPILVVREHALSIDASTATDQDWLVMETVYETFAPHA